MIFDSCITEEMRCSWKDIPHQLLSLSDMVELNAGLFIDRYAVARNLSEMLSETSPNRQKLQLHINALKSLQEECERIGLANSAIQARRIIVSWDQAFPLDTIRSQVQDLLSRIQDELFATCFYYIRPDKALSLIQDPQLGSAYPHQIRLKRTYEFFGPAVTTRFPAIRRDLEEAIRCFAFECNPACVIHLMRATEIGIPKIAKMCDIDDQKPSWG